MGSSHFLRPRAQAHLLSPLSSRVCLFAAEITKFADLSLSLFVFINIQGSRVHIRAFFPVGGAHDAQLRRIREDLTPLWYAIEAATAFGSLGLATL